MRHLWVRVRRRRTRTGTGRTETAYAVTSLAAHQGSPADLGDAVRGHWHVENELHWVRDVTYDADRSQIRTSTGPQVMASLRNLAVTVLRLSGVTILVAHADASRSPGGEASGQQAHGRQAPSRLGSPVTRPRTDPSVRC